MNKELNAKDLLQENINGTISAHWLVLAPLSIVAEQEHKQWLKQHCLDHNESARLQRFRRQQDQDRYLLAHSLKRLCLSYLLNKKPLDCQFAANDKGKPFCVDTDTLDFNLSHSGDWVALAASTKGMIGVDVEAADRSISEGVARYALTPQQLAIAEGNQERLLTYWTQKEAISKALGKGLSIDFQTVECDGCLGVSHSSHSGHCLRVESRWVDSDNAYMLSVASLAAEKPKYFLVSAWQQMHLILRSF